MTAYHDHRPVMYQEVAKFLAPESQKIYLDGTFGRGGHSRLILENQGKVIGVDRDLESIQWGEANLAPQYPGSLALVHQRFSHMDSAWEEGLERLGLPKESRPHGILLDLGVSSPQLDDPARGFSFREEGPLDMGMGLHSCSAYEIVNRWSEKNLGDLIYAYGEEPLARLIARKILEARSKGPIESIQKLVSLITWVYGKCYGRRPSRRHPATKTFQALRMAVNEELKELSQGLDQGMDLLEMGGTLVVISFHSLEDRIVKGTFKGGGEWFQVSKKPMTPEEEEIEKNPRARSGKLRWAQKVKHSQRSGR